MCVLTFVRLNPIEKSGHKLSQQEWNELKRPNLKLKASALQRFFPFRYPISILHQAMVARWYIFKPKILIWVNFGVACSARCWYILWPFGPFYCHFVYFIAILYILWSFWYIFPFWYVVARKIWQPYIKHHSFYGNFKCIYITTMDIFSHQSRCDQIKYSAVGKYFHKKRIYQSLRIFWQLGNKNNW
jgi:hypothetical protein